MSLSDPIGDMIARIKNAQERNHKKVELPSSNFKTKIADILKNEGFIKNFKVNKENNKFLLSLEFEKKFFIASDISLGLYGLKYKAPSLQISGNEAQLDTITGQPHDIASIGGKPKPSYVEACI